MEFKIGEGTPKPVRDVIEKMIKSLSEDFIDNTLQRVGHFAFDSAYAFNPNWNEIRITIDNTGIVNVNVLEE